MDSRRMGDTITVTDAIETNLSSVGCLVCVGCGAWF